LLTGESGTGKEVVARNIHFQSHRRHKPFVPVNCGAIHADLLESELFGHEKGAFTGAITARRGRFEMAEGGTLFLDEIGDMPQAMQVKLLRVIQERVFERVGSEKSIHMQVRIITATHIDLDQAIENGSFREDLYYRLSVFPMEIPSLRQRIEDLPLLINDLISRLSSGKGHAIRFSPDAVRCLSAYSWPGNVRELANLIERVLILYPGGTVDARDLPERYRRGSAWQTDEIGHAPRTPGYLLPPDTLPSGGLDLKEHLEQLEYRIIEKALQESGGVVAKAAKQLKLGRTTLVEKMRKFGLSRQDVASNI
jgi:sigma-54 specific flagellar transcriptional regulator A